MRVLIDTHVFLWFITNSKELSSAAKGLIENQQNRLLISIASLWELSIKTAQGKLVIEGGFENVLNDLNMNSIEILPIIFPHTLKQNQLPFHHTDPFDRMIAAQAIFQGFDLISVDAAFDPYFVDAAVKRLW